MIIEEIKSMSAMELRVRWRDPNEERFVREEALWEYWRRVAEGTLSFSAEELLDALSLDNARTVDVLGLLARRDLLDSASLKAARRFQATLKEDVWLAAQLDARDMIRRLTAGEQPTKNELCDALVAKGTAWAALQAIAFLSQEELASVLRASEERRVFTKGQRHELRELASRDAR